jgi:hypothetical protein
MRPAPRAAALAALLAAAARADGASVVLARERSDDAALERAELRVAAELRAAGFAVEERDVDGALEARHAIEEGAAGDDTERPFAAVLLRRAPFGTATDIWVADHIAKQTVVRHIDVGRGEAAEGLLAMRVVELMRASLTDPTPKPPAPPPAPPPPAVAPTPPPAPSPARFELGAGLAALYGSDFGAAWGPTLHASLAPCDLCRLGLIVAGPAFGPGVEAREGSASLRQELALAEASLDLTQSRLARPFLGVGGGAYHLRANGTGRTPFVDARDDAWAALGSIGAGARLHLAPNVGAALGVRALFPFPRPVLDFAGNHVAAAGRPSWLLTLSLDAELGGT